MCGLKLKQVRGYAICIVSHPAWVCGLKHNLQVCLCRTNGVTPCVGVWIETFAPSSKPCLYPVTPCVGVWIETRGLRELTAASVVTPCVGVWIETSILQQRVNLPLLSHPAWVCGLKQVNDSFKQCRNRSHTLRGCVD